MRRDYLGGDIRASSFSSSGRPRRDLQKLLKSVAQFPERTHIVGAYALGKAQRIIALLREARYEKTIYIHGAMASLCALYEAFGVKLGPLEPATISKGEKSAFAGEIVIAPPLAFQEKWARRFQDPLPAFASGWMRIRARARQGGIELPLILSDHADWDELTTTIEEVAPQELWVTHGRDDALLRWAELKGLKAKPLRLVGYEDEND